MTIDTKRPLPRFAGRIYLRACKFEASHEIRSWLDLQTRVPGRRLSRPHRRLPREAPGDRTGLQGAGDRAAVCRSVVQDRRLRPADADGLQEHCSRIEIAFRGGVVGLRPWSSDCGLRPAFFVRRCVIVWPRGSSGDVSVKVFWAMLALVAPCLGACQLPTNVATRRVDSLRSAQDTCLRENIVQFDDRTSDAG